MRLSILIGLVMIAGAGFALYKTQNGFFMYAMGHITHGAPATADEAEAAFAAMADEPVDELGATTGGYARARLACVAESAAIQPSDAVAAAFIRLNQVLVGVGANSSASVIAPGARRLAELRPDLTLVDRHRETPDLNARDFTMAKDELDALLDVENPIYAGLDLYSDFGHLDLLKLTNAMEAGGARLFECVRERRF